MALVTLQVSALVSLSMFPWLINDVEENGTTLYFFSDWKKEGVMWKLSLSIIYCRKYCI